MGRWERGEQGGKGSKSLVPLPQEGTELKGPPGPQWGLQSSAAASRQGGSSRSCSLPLQPAGVNLKSIRHKLPPHTHFLPQEQVQGTIS